MLDKGYADLEQAMARCSAQVQTWRLASWAVREKQAQKQFQKKKETLITETGRLKENESMLP